MTPESLRGATVATFAAFGASGLAFASLFARIPQIRDQLGLTPGGLGLTLLAGSAGSVLALVLAGPVVARHGSRRVVSVSAVLFAVGLATAAVGALVAVLPVVVGLFVLGAATGAWDVAMNLQGTVLERHLGRPIMSRLHAGFSVGTVAGALVGAALVALSVPVAVHLGVVAVVVAGCVPGFARGFLPDEPASAGPAPRTGFGAWREPQTLLIGLFVLAFTLAEGAGNDWIVIAAVDGHRAAPAIGTLAFAAFLAAMTAGRWCGPWLLHRYGRVPVLRGLAVTGLVGAALFVFAPALPLALAGAVLWGLGTALGFPVGMSAAAADPAFAAGRVSVVATIGYCAFLAGPPLLGLLGDRLTVLRALVVVAVLFGVATFLSGALREGAAR
ncbi:MFS transporter [Asanoa sp. WMMD1127]|uniref:MFS transporter n=1 Tax=Asanoa sp. WMMD1127 TaxID=3016107 RepID=UPI00241791CA|nr:MFS transporter [Asanoa sp. WMMD1127]MDG4825510.1 MFS transporter [Asanoa sp. WMMD1127]